MSEKLKVIFDTQIFLRALIKRTSLSARISSVEWRGFYTLFLTDAIETEITDVLNRPEIRKKFPQISNELVQQTLDDLKQAKRVTVEAVEAISRTLKTTSFSRARKRPTRIIW